jgi:ATP-dependent Zn protease
MMRDMEAAKKDNNTERIKKLEKAAFLYRKKLWEEGIKYPIDHKMNYAVTKLNDNIKEVIKDYINSQITIVQEPIEYIIESKAIIKAKIKQYAPWLILAFGGLYAAKALYSLFKKQIHRNWEKKLFSWSFSPYEYNNTKKLSQLYGYSSIKRYMKDIITLLKKDKKKRILRNYEGIIFYGPPGCGKTTFVYALGAEVNVKLFTISISDILADPTSGMNKVELIFDKIASLGKKKPVILFLDEIDLLIPSRNKEMSQEEKEILQLFLTYMDGNKLDKRGVIVVGCTNKYDELDPALKRFGRMGVSLPFPLPDKEAIIELLEEIILKNERVTFEDQDFLIDKLQGKTTAEIVALLLKIQNKIKKYKKKYITNSLLLEEIF